MVPPLTLHNLQGFKFKSPSLSLSGPNVCFRNDAEGRFCLDFRAVLRAVPHSSGFVFAVGLERSKAQMRVQEPCTTFQVLDQRLVSERTSSGCLEAHCNPPMLCSPYGVWLSLALIYPGFSGVGQRRLQTESMLCSSEVGSWIGIGFPPPGFLKMHGECLEPPNTTSRCRVGATHLAFRSWPDDRCVKTEGRLF